MYINDILALKEHNANRQRCEPKSLYEEIALHPKKFWWFVPAQAKTLVYPGWLVQELPKTLFTLAGLSQH